MRSTELNRTKIVSSLYLFIVVLAILSVVLGMNLMSLAREFGHGDPYQTMSLHETSACVLTAGILFIAFAVHRSIQRLSNIDNAH